MKILLTLGVVFRGEEVLLGMKKRGFGAGLWNGFGGKVDSTESILAAAKRELKEEVGITAVNLIPAGVLEFTFVDQEDLLEVYVFKVTHYEGEPIETEEMRPRWFSKTDIPFTEMWADDEYWFPYLIEDKLFKGKFHFDRPATADYSGKILNYHLSAVSKL